MDSNHFHYAPAAYPCIKSFKFKVPNSRFVSPRNFSLPNYSLSNKLYERCVVLTLIVCLFCFDILILRTSWLWYFGTLSLWYFSWWRIRESNPWPSACKADALANWANPPCQSPVFSLSVQFYCLLRLFTDHFFSIQSQFSVFSFLPTVTDHCLLGFSVVPPRFELGTPTLSV